MGLREMHAAQTRTLISDAAFGLFLSQGYDATTMEEIASAAGVGTTTLYRYYPSKDLLVVGPLELNGQMATELAARPPAEPLDIALGHAITALAVTPRAEPFRLRQIQQVLDSTPSLVNRLYEEFVKERTLLQHAIAERLGRPANDIYCNATAHTTTMVIELVSSVHPGSGASAGSPTAAESVAAVLDALANEPPVLPRVLPTDAPQ